MRIAFYLDPYICNVQSFYQKILLKQELARLGHILVIHLPIPVEKFRKKFKTKYYNYIVPYNNNQFKYPIEWSIPSPDQYDALFILHTHNKKWDSDHDWRTILAQDFLQQKKPVISLKDDLSLEYHSLNLPGIKHAVYSTFRSKLKEHLSLPKDVITFLLPTWGGPLHRKPHSLSRSSFMSKYALDPKHHLIIFFLPRYQKVQALQENHIMWLQSFFWIMENISEFMSQLKLLGYQLIFKAHRGDRDNFFLTYNLNHYGVKLLEPIDTYEAITYSKWAITCFSNICYELYLNNLPVIELGPGVYYPGWWNNSKYKPKRFFPFYNFKGTELIWGVIVDIDEFLDDPNQILEKILVQTPYPKIGDYPYLRNHPIYGSSYGTSMKTVAGILAHQLVN